MDMQKNQKEDTIMHLWWEEIKIKNNIKKNQKEQVLISYMLMAVLWS